ncbi:Cytochrome c553 [Humidesulfovibrio mexicanus]|uniref:Cytochrome c553 n=1 Tax=Humidesulfovibrio mexicanus TaxID=147047 RepID=A0A239D4B8_9BACT|nr:hypothetical protein [Humidesulfovibrio mexicanus]SNS27346.1 Cytochrome c553 [Humidesulfovibrio mexicanus]
MKKLLVFAIGLYALLMVSGLVFAQASAGKLVARTCVSCHAGGRICEKLGTRPQEAWLQTVDRMRSNGATVSETDAATIAEYLSTAKPGVKPLCGK